MPDSVRAIFVTRLSSPACCRSSKPFSAKRSTIFEIVEGRTFSTTANAVTETLSPGVKHARS